MSREVRKEATKTDPNSVQAIVSMELPDNLNGENQEISYSNASDLDGELDTLISSEQNQNQETTPPATKTFFKRPGLWTSPTSSIGLLGSPYLSLGILSVINSPFTPRNPESADEISNSPLRDLRTQKQCQSSGKVFTPKNLDLESKSDDKIFNSSTKHRRTQKQYQCISGSDFTPKILDLESKSDDKISNSPQRVLSHSKRKQCQSSGKVFTPKNLDLESKSDDKIFNSSTKHRRTQKQYQLLREDKSHAIYSVPVDEISNSPLRDLRTQKQYQSLREDKSPALYSKTNLYQYASDKNSKVRVSNEKTFVGDELSKLVIVNVNSAKEQFLARCLKKNIDINTENINAFVLKVIEFAQANEGVGNVHDGEQKWHDFTKDNQDLKHFSYKDAKAFSSIYQSVSGENGVYSGRQENLRSDIKVAARLKRIPEELNDRIKESLSQAVVTRSI